MTTYAPVPAFADRKRHPRALLLIIGGHAALLAAVMTAKMDLPAHWDPTITKVKLIPEPKAPPEAVPEPEPDRRETVIDRVPRIVPVPQPSLPDIEPLPLPLPLPLPDPNPGAGIGNSTDVLPKRDPVRTGPHFTTPESLVKPPYPQHKLRMEEEAVLQLRLTIDQRGRVTAVDPVGPADRMFLAAARKHVLRHWRYRPATEDGRAVASSTVITLRFQLD